MPLDNVGGKAVSFVACIKSVGISIVVLSSLSLFSATTKRNSTVVLTVAHLENSALSFDTNWLTTD